MPKRIRDTLIAVAVAGALAGGTAVIAQAATSGSSSTGKAPAAKPRSSVGPGLLRSGYLTAESWCATTGATS